MPPLSQVNPQLGGSQLRKPTISVTLNGNIPFPALEAQIDNTAHFTADTFRLVCALSDMPKGYDQTYWADSANDQVNIAIGLDNQAPVNFILGQVDDVDWDIVKKKLTFTGRDLTANFIDTKTVDIYLNQTSSQVAAALAKGHGMQTNIQATTTPIGTYFASSGANSNQGQFTTLTRNQSEWDVLIFLAQSEGFDVWVSQNTLNFQPAINLQAATPYVVIYSDTGQGGAGRFSSFSSMTLHRSETLARDVIVNVRSWNQQQQQVFTVQYKLTQASKNQRQGGKAQIYSFTVPNLDHNQAVNYAKRKAEEITRNERVISFDVAGDLSTNLRQPFNLVGTGTAFDQKYFPDSISRTVSFGGFRMKVRAKNHSTQSTVLL